MKAQAAMITLVALAAFPACLKRKATSATESAVAPDVNKVAEECKEFVLDESSKPADHWAWLNKDQAHWDHVFHCARLPRALPIGNSIGHGTMRGTESQPFNDLQGKLGSTLWAGKILSKQPDGRITLLNKMVESGDLRYNAWVRGIDDCSVCISGFDGEPSLILDYRIDTTAQDSKAQNAPEAILDPIIHAVRDEIREVAVVDDSGHMTGSGLYVGRANIYKEFHSLEATTVISDEEFRDKDKYFLGANFSLDFSAGAE